MLAHRFHRGGVAHDLQRFDDRLHPLRRKNVGDRFVMARDGNRLRLRLFQQPREIGLGAGDIICTFHANIIITPVSSRQRSKLFNPNPPLISARPFARRYKFLANYIFGPTFSRL